MYRASQEQLQSLLVTAEKLSRHYSKKYPDIDYQEFYSISQVAITKALQRYNPRKGKLLPRVKIFIYERFNQYAKNQFKPIIMPPHEIMYADNIDIVHKIKTVGLTAKEKQAVECFLKYSEPPANPPERNAFYRAVRKLRTRC